MSLGLTDLEPAERHRVVALGFGELVGSVVDWEAPTPVTGWVARDVVAHLLEWFPAFLASGGIELPPGPSVDVDPVGAWTAQCAAVQALLDDACTAESTFVHPQAGTHQLAVAIDEFYVADVFMHTWDLARACGREPDLDQEFCGQLLDAMVPIDEMLRASGHYGPRVAVPDEVDSMTRLMGFIGRDPTWQDSDPN
jgi:uncharacterized protein (TIGR03086 family)